MLYFLFSLSPIGWARESDGNDLLSSFLLFLFSFSFCLLPCFPPRQPYACVFSSSLCCCFVRKIAVIFFVLFCPCSSSCLLRVVLPVQEVYVSLQRVWLLWQLQPFILFSGLLAEHSSDHLSLVMLCFPCSVFFFLCFSFFLFFFIARLVSLCSRTRYASTSLALP